MQISQLHTYKNSYKLREHQKKLFQILKQKFTKKFNVFKFHQSIN